MINDRIAASSVQLPPCAQCSRSIGMLLKREMLIGVGADQRRNPIAYVELRLVLVEYWKLTLAHSHGQATTYL